MPFDRPSLAELDARLAADIVSRLPGTDPQLRRSLLGALARALAGAHHELYGYADWIARQAFPDTAEDPELLRWAAIWGVERAAPVAATGTITVTGTNDTVIPEATVWRSGAGVGYETTAEATITDGTADIAVRASVAGATGNAADGTKVSLVSPITGVVSEAAFVGAIGGGADIEGIASVRTRLLARLRAPPRGGTASDYVLWARAGHAAATRAWARPRASGLGTVTVYLMTDDATDNGVPAAAVVTAVQDYIDAQRPVTADVTVAAPTPVALDITITDVVPDTEAVRAAIQAEIEDLILRESEPGGTILVSHIREAISTAFGEADHVLTAPVADVEHQDDEIAIAGSFTWSTS